MYCSKREAAAVKTYVAVNRMSSRLQLTPKQRALVAAMPDQELDCFKNKVPELQHLPTHIVRQRLLKK